MIIDQPNLTQVKKFKNQIFYSHIILFDFGIFMFIPIYVCKWINVNMKIKDNICYKWLENIVIEKQAIIFNKRYNTLIWKYI